MKRILITILISAFCISMEAQKISALTEATVADDNSLIMTRVGNSGDLIRKISLGNVFKDRTLTGTITLPATTSIGTVSDTELSYLNNVTSAIQTQINEKETRIDSIVTVLNDTIDGSSVYVELLDTISLVTFGIGAGFASDTACFNNGALAGSFYNGGSDTLVIKKLVAILKEGTGTETIDVQIAWHTTFLSASATLLNSSALTVNSLTTGTEDIAFANAKIPPNVFVWCTLSGASKDNKPTYLNVTLSGNKIPKY